jgi:hypothetical protein
MFFHAGMILAVMVASFAVARLLKWNTELSMLGAAVAGALAHGAGIPFRHFAEGAFTYFDVCLIFITATLFMNIVKEAGGVVYIIRGILIHFQHSRFFCLLLLTFVLLIPGALTGAGTVTCLVVGSLVGTVLGYMGVPKNKVAAIVFLCAAMSAAAPPINLYAMMAAAGANMPYVGFYLPLAVISITGALFSMFYLGWRGTPVDLDKVLAELPTLPQGLNLIRVATPFVVLAVLVVAGRIWPYDMPILGLPLIFLLSAATTVLLSPNKLPVWKITSQTIENLLPLLAIMIVVGILIQILALTGARGLISLAVVTIPLVGLFCTLWLILPFSEGLVQYAVAPLIGVPLVFLFNMKGLNPIIALAGMATIWPLGDCLPPTAVVGRAAVMTVAYEGSYYAGFVKTCIVPALFISFMGTLYIILSKPLSFLAVF